ncbi:hypothetical protein [Larkinella soli]|uniref:hypothetical protein n=1 Tax=Larkinella soli TaxID=1770527 RepID=UPI000FFB6DFF|nr:hypothetical protein [Larkinella soli]
MKYLLSVACLLFVFCALTVRAQDTTRVTTATPADTSINASGAESLLEELSDSTSGGQELLPKKMVFTQRPFWGPKGLFRVTNIAPLTPEGRAKELKIRRTMLVTHQVLGFVTLAGMITQGILGTRLYNAKGADYARIRERHETVATFINWSYGATALLSLTAPPRLPTASQRKGFNSLKIHRGLAFVHLAGMITTNVLARRISGNPDLKPYHRAAAFTTFASFAAAIVIIKF